MNESDILHETKNLTLRRIQGKLDIFLEGATHAKYVGTSPSIEKAKQTMERLERYPDKLKKFMGEL